MPNSLPWYGETIHEEEFDEDTRPQPEIGTTQVFLADGMYVDHELFGLLGLVQ